MGNGNIITGGNGDGDGNSTGGCVSPVTALECDVGLGLNTEQSFYPSKKMNFFSSYHNQDSEIYGYYGTGNQMAAGISSKHVKDGYMGVSGKLLFTANQWQELELQTMIYKYIMASIPIPPQLLLPLSTQSNRVSTGLRFANGSDPEPWRCRRTDGKKWRCAKDVAPDQKYCERHTHKTRSRSRKPVETQSHKTKYNPTTLSGANQPTRGNEWIIKNCAIPVTQLNNQFQQPPMHSPSGSIKREHFQNTNYLDHTYRYLSNTGNSTAASGDDCSLTLSMQSGGNATEFDHESFQMAVGMLNGDRGGGCGDVFKPHNQWLNQPSWMGSCSGSGSGSGSGLGLTPGGPLGEALCLGISSTQNEQSSHGYSNNTTPSSSSCEGGGDHGLGFNR